MVVDQVKIFEGKSPDDIPCKISIDTAKYLPSADDDEKSGCIGGFKMLVKRGKIVLSQTVDERIALCFQAAIPAIRYMLFPSMRKKKAEELKE